MYRLILASHNFFRWIVVIVAVLALVRVYLGLFGNREWTRRDHSISTFFAVSLDIQFLLGIILYIFLSPLTTPIFENFGAAMQDAAIRFFALEHFLYMLAALVLVHIGNSRARRAAESKGKYRTLAIFYSLAVLFIVLGMPWSRPLIRGF